MIRRSGNRSSSQGRYTRYLAHYTRRNYAVLLLGALFIAGVFLGAVLIRSSQGEAHQALVRLMENFLVQRATQGLTEVFFSCAVSSLLFTSILFICGFCAIAQPVVVAMPLFRGLGFGFSVSALYAQYGLTASGYIALFMLPDMLLSTMVMLFCCRESLRLSGSFLAAANPSRQNRDFYSMRIYVARYLAAAVCCVASAFLQAVIFTAFAKYVVLG